MRTRLTELLGIEHPVMLAGMGGVSYAALASAVSAAGASAASAPPPWATRRWSRRWPPVRAATDKPFGVDLLTAMPGGMVEQVTMVIEGGATAFVAGLGVPTEVIDLCHRHDLVVVSMCGKVEHAVRAVEAGCDLVVAQGTEAGGHTGQVATFPLVPQIVDAVGGRVPVVAAGGIFDGRGLAAALSLGADGIWVGTRFIATPEARGVLGYKDTLVASREDQTTISRAYSGKTMRVVRNSYTDYYDAHPDELKKFPEQLPRLVRQRRDAPRRRLLQLKASTSTRSATRQAREWGPSPSSCRQPTSCGASWPRRRRCSTGSLQCAERLSDVAPLRATQLGRHAGPGKKM